MRGLRPLAATLARLTAFLRERAIRDLYGIGTLESQLPDGQQHAAAFYPFLTTTLNHAWKAFTQWI